MINHQHVLREELDFRYISGLPTMNSNFKLINALSKYSTQQNIVNFMNVLMNSNFKWINALFKYSTQQNIVNFINVIIQIHRGNLCPETTSSNQSLKDFFFLFKNILNRNCFQNILTRITDQEGESLGPKTIHLIASKLHMSHIQLHV